MIVHIIYFILHNLPYILYRNNLLCTDANFENTQNESILRGSAYDHAEENVQFDNFQFNQQ